jgi:hypothetical protein
VFKFYYCAWDREKLTAASHGALTKLGGGPAPTINDDDKYIGLLPY